MIPEMFYISKEDLERVERSCDLGDSREVRVYVYPHVDLPKELIRCVPLFYKEEQMTFKPGDKVLWINGSLSNPINTRAVFIRYSSTRVKAEIKVEATDECKMVLVENLNKIKEK